MSVVTCSCLGAVTRSRTASIGATPSLRGFSLKTCKLPHRRWAFSFKEILQPSTAHPYDSKCFISSGAYCSKSARESEISSTSYGTEFTVYLHTGSHPVSKSRVTAFTVLKEHPGVACNLLTELLVFLSVGAFQTWQTAVLVSVASHSSRAEHWAVYQFYFCQLPLPNKSAHIFTHVTWMGPLPASPQAGSSHSNSLACHCPCTSPKLATIEVAVLGPKKRGG